MPLTVPGRRVLVASALLVGAIAGVAGWVMLSDRPRPGAYLDVLALEGDFVVAIREETHSHRAFVELVALGEGMRWQALIPSYAAGEGVGIAASEQALTVRFPRSGHAQVFAFSAQNARKLGALNLGFELPPEDDGHLGSIASLSGGATSFELLAPDGRAPRLYAVSHISGTVPWWKDLPAPVETAWVTTDHVILAHPDAVTALDRDGALVTEAGDAACAIPGVGGARDVIVVGKASGVDLLELERGAIAARAHVDGVDGMAGPCGRRGERLYIALAGGAIAEIVDGAVARRIDVGAAIRPIDWPSAPLAAPFAGELGRVEPIVTAAGLVGVDLQAGAVAWQRPLADGAVVVDAGERVLVRTGDELASIDVGTGEAHAVRVPPTSRPLRAHHVAGGAVWVIDARGLVALDVGTLAPRGTWRQPGEITSP